MSNRKKRAQMAKRQRRLTMALLPHIAIVHHSSHLAPYVVTLDLRTMRPVELTRQDADTIADLQHIWHVHTSVELDIQGEVSVKTHQHAVKERMKQADLVPYLQDYHVEQMKAERADHFCGYGWIATPHARDLSEAQIARIYAVAHRVDEASHES